MSLVGALRFLFGALPGHLDEAAFGRPFFNNPCWLCVASLAGALRFIFGALPNRLEEAAKVVIQRRPQGRL